MDKQFENTLGKLINNLRRATHVPEELETLLTRALKKRNWLCHHYFRVRAIEFITMADQDAMIAELREAQGLLTLADTLLSKTIHPLADRFGITKEVYEAEYQRLLEESEVVAYLNHSK